MLPMIVPRLLMTIASGIELAALLTTMQSSAGRWEPMWVLGVQAFHYFLYTVQPGAGDMHLTNGAVIPWLRYLTWLLTCPVLLMFVVTMTTYGGRSAAVKLVPLLVLNQLMVLMVITAQSNEDVLVIKWLLVFVAATCFGMIISFSVNCLRIRRFKTRLPPASVPPATRQTRSPPGPLPRGARDAPALLMPGCHG